MQFLCPSLIAHIFLSPDHVHLLVVADQMEPHTVLPFDSAEPGVKRLPITAYPPPNKIHPAVGFETKGMRLCATELSLLR